MSASAASSAPLDLKPLTALRFFAAIWVVGFHYWPHLSSGPMPLWQEKGYLGVELFFVLSGFILSHVYLQSAGEGRLNYRSFLWARLSRVYPLHLATLLGLLALGIVAMVMGIGSDKLLAWSSLPAQLLLVQGWGLGQAGGWNHPAWSISAEWFAYLAFPAFAAVTWSLRRWPVLAVSLAALFVVALNIGFSGVTGEPLTRQTLNWGALRIVPCFFMGCATYLLWRKHAVTDRGTAVRLAGSAASAVAIGAIIGIPDALMVMLFGGLIFAVGSLPTAGSKILSSKPWVWLGEVSFAVYMVCIPWELVCTKAAEKALNLPEGGVLPWPLWAAMFVSVVGVAALAHHLVERPARAAMRGWEVKRALKKQRLGMALRTA